MPEQRLGRKEKFGYGLGDMASNIADPVLGATSSKTIVRSMSTSPGVARKISMWLQIYFAVTNFIL